MVTNSYASPYSQFSFGERLGIVFVVESASLSALAVASLLAYISYSAATFKHGATRKWSVSTHIHYYFVNLLVSDLIQAIGAMLSMKWILDANISLGALCIAQGTLKQAGDVGVALTTMVIAIHTFCVLVFRWHSPPRLALIVIILIWTFIISIVSVGLVRQSRNQYYGPTQYWCWITDSFLAERIAFEYVWMWLTASLNIVLYVGMALIIKGVIVVDGRKIKFPQKENRISRSLRSVSGNDKTRSNFTVAMEMLFYPAIYLIATLPMAVVRWLTFSGRTVPYEATMFASILFSSSGLLNVLLFAFTRPKLMPIRRHQDPGDISVWGPSSPSAASFSSRITLQSRHNSLHPSLHDSKAWKARSQYSTFNLPRSPKTAVSHASHSKASAPDIVVGEPNPHLYTGIVSKLIYILVD